MTRPYGGCPATSQILIHLPFPPFSLSALAALAGCCLLQAQAGTIIKHWAPDAARLVSWPSQEECVGAHDGKGHPGSHKATHLRVLPLQLSAEVGG
eukprot:9099094-Ditylum_brightwellii.AAC.1